jgi:hypothetical protein
VARARPNSRRPTPAAQPIERSRAAALRSLIGPELVGAIQVGREYPGRHVLSDDELAAHFAGEIAVAIRVGNGKGRSRHLVIDVDARAEERVTAVLSEFRRLGYAGATIATSGSSGDRGKVVVFFRSEQQNAALRALAGAVLDPLRRTAEWGIESPGDVAVYPQRGEGGLARIGGRNIGRNGAVERLYSAWGDVVDLSAIAPSTSRLRPVRDRGTAVRTTPRQAWVLRLMREGVTWTGVGGTRGINALVNRLASETLRTHGSAEFGRAEFAKVLETIAAASPDLLQPSPKNKDRRHPLAWGRRAGSAWDRVCEQRSQVDTTFSAPAKSVVSTSGVVREAVALLFTIVQRRGLNPIAFEVSYRELGSMLGISHEAARQRILRAEQVGLVVRLDPGIEGSGGTYTGRPGGGAKVLYALVPSGETPQAVRDRVEDHHAVRRRRTFAVIERERREQRRQERLSANLLPFRGANAPEPSGSHGTSAGSPLGCRGEYVPPSPITTSDTAGLEIDLMAYAREQIKQKRV